MLKTLCRVVASAHLSPNLVDAVSSIANDTYDKLDAALGSLAATDEALETCVTEACAQLMSEVRSLGTRWPVRFVPTESAQYLCLIQTCLTALETHALSPSTAHLISPLLTLLSSLPVALYLALGQLTYTRIATLTASNAALGKRQAQIYTLAPLLRFHSLSSTPSLVGLHHLGERLGPTVERAVLDALEQGMLTSGSGFEMTISAL